MTKINDTIQILQEKVIYFLNKICNECKIKQDKICDKLQLIAEHLAFDFIYQKYNIEMESLEKALYLGNLTVVEI
jgi:hypothetical protein